MTKRTPPKLGYSIREACLATSLSKTTIYVHIATGRLRTVRIGARTIIHADSLRALLGLAPEEDQQAANAKIGE